MVVSDKSPKQPKDAMSWKKYSKKVKEAIGKKKLVAYEKMSSLNEDSPCIELIQMLMPVGLQAIKKEIQSEVSKLAGARYTRTHNDLKRWGSAKRDQCF